VYRSSGLFLLTRIPTQKFSCPATRGNEWRCIAITIGVFLEKSENHCRSTTAQDEHLALDSAVAALQGHRFVKCHAVHRYRRIGKDALLRCE
jgi:hypothetical protein